MNETQKIEFFMHRLTGIVAKAFDFTTLEAVRAVCMSETLKRIINNISEAGTPEQEGERLIAELRKA